jgi:hypothetical protein
MAGRLCRICSDNGLLKEAATLVAQGSLSDPEIAARLGLPGEAGRMAVSRHRRNHIEKIARQLAVAASKGRDNTEKREQLVQAAQSGDAVQAFLGLEQITRDLRAVSERLERNADAAERDEQRMAVGSLSAQQLKAVEMRGKLGGHGAFAPQKANPAGVPAFSINFVFSGEGRRRETIECMPTAAAIEGEPRSLPGLSSLGVAVPAEHLLPSPVDAGDDEWGGEEDDV